MRLTRLFEDLGWDDVGLQDPGIAPTTLNNNPEADWGLLVRRFKRGHLNIQEFMSEAVAGLVSGRFESAHWYDLGEIFHIDERGMDDIMSIAHADDVHPERKEALISGIIGQNI